MGKLRIWPTSICLLVGQSLHHLKNTQHFMQHIKEVKLEPGEVMTSYDIKALSTCVPLDPSINIVKQKLQQHPLLSQRTSMSIQQIVKSHSRSFASKTLTSSSRESIINRSMVLSWVSPISPFIANLFMEEFEVKALSFDPHTPHLWLRYLDEPSSFRRKTLSTITKTHYRTHIYNSP